MTTREALVSPSMIGLGMTSFSGLDLTRGAWCPEVVRSPSARLANTGRRHLWLSSTCGCHLTARWVRWLCITDRQATMPLYGSGSKIHHEFECCVSIRLRCSYSRSYWDKPASQKAKYYKTSSVGNECVHLWTLFFVYIQVGGHQGWASGGETCSTLKRRDISRPVILHRQVVACQLQWTMSSLQPGSLALRTMFWPSPKS